MFHCCSRDEIVSADEELSRAFATVGLLRHVVKATPIDQVCVYIVQTQVQYGGIFDRACRINQDVPGYCKWRNHMTINENEAADRVKIMPDGIVKMSQDYLIRTFWKQITHLTGKFCHNGGRRGWNNEICGGPVSRIRIFPKELLKTLSSMYVPNTGRIYDLRMAISALHAVATPTMLDAPEWVDHRDNIRYSYIKRYFEPMKNEHLRKIDAILNVLNDYLYQPQTKSDIPNDIEKNILLDLIESFLVMFGPRSFADNYVMRQTYEYFRLYDTLGTKSAKYRSYQYAFDWADPERYSKNDGIESTVFHLKNLSPEAAICMCDINRFMSEYGFYWGALNPKMLEMIHPQPIPEVALYLKRELDTQRSKLKYSHKVLEAIRKGEYTFEMTADGCRCDEVAECSDAPAPCAG